MATVSIENLAFQPVVEKKIGEIFFGKNNILKHKCWNFNSIYIENELVNLVSVFKQIVEKISGET